VKQEHDKRREQKNTLSGEETKVTFPGLEEGGSSEKKLVRSRKKGVEAPH